jgi:hypothetical protein
LSIPEFLLCFFLPLQVLNDFESTLSVPRQQIFSLAGSE